MPHMLLDFNTIAGPSTSTSATILPTTQHTTEVVETMSLKMMLEPVMASLQEHVTPQSCPLLLDPSFSDSNHVESTIWDNGFVYKLNF